MILCMVITVLFVKVFFFVAMITKLRVCITYMTREYNKEYKQTSFPE